MRGLDPRIPLRRQKTLSKTQLDYCEAMDPRIRPAGDTRGMKC